MFVCTCESACPIVDFIVTNILKVVLLYFSVAGTPGHRSLLFMYVTQINQYISIRFDFMLRMRTPFLTVIEN